MRIYFEWLVGNILPDSDYSFLLECFNILSNIDAKFLDAVGIDKVFSFIQACHNQ